jgi:hypothetical protein
MTTELETFKIVDEITENEVQFILKSPPLTKGFIEDKFRDYYKQIGDYLLSRGVSTDALCGINILKKIDNMANGGLNDRSSRG